MTKSTDLTVVSKGFYWNGWQVVFHFAELDGRRRPVGIDFRSAQEVLDVEDGKVRRRWKRLHGSAPRALTASELRALPLGTYARWAADELRQEFLARAAGDFWADETVDSDVDRTMFAQAAAELEERPSYGEDHFKQVAAIYSRAWRDGLPPTKAVAEELHGSRTAAAKWVARARKMGLLGDTEQRKPGGVAAKPARKGR